MDNPAKYWLREITGYETRQKKARWHMWARHAIDRYLLSTHGVPDDPESDNKLPRYNIFWSNIENLKPGMYAKTPKPVVMRRYADNNLVAGKAAQVLERIIAYQLSEHGFGAAVRAARDDYLLVGRGVAWVRYIPHIKALPSHADVELDLESFDPADVESGDPKAKTPEVLDFEEVAVDYVHWSDFGHTDARRWEGVRGVWRRIRLTKEEVKARFAGWETKLAFDATTVRSDVDDQDMSAKDNEGAGEGLATLYECWDRTKRQIIFVAKGQAEAVAVITDDPLKLPHFFPMARPIYATLANEDLFPVSDYRQYRTQIRQIHDLTKRIDNLTSAVKVVGAYDGSVPELKDLFKQADNTLIPVTNWAALAGKGGLDGTISLVPMKEIAETLAILHGERDKALADSYQLTGISDLIRGDTQASETATAQNIKNNYITMRFDEKKREVDRLVVNTINIMGSIICRQFTDDTIIKMSGVQLCATPEEKAQLQAELQAAEQPPQPGQPPMQQPPMPSLDKIEMLDHPTWQEVMALLRNEPERSFLIDIEVDSSVQADREQQKGQAVEFLQAVGGFLSQAEQAAQSTPQLLPLMGKMLEWGVRNFPIGRDLEDAVASAVEDMAKAAKQAQGQPPKPDPAMAKVQADQQLAQAKLQGEQQLAQAKLQSDHAIGMAKVQLAASDQAHDQGMEVAGMHANAAQAQDDAHRGTMTDVVKAHVDAALKMQQAQFSAQTAVLVAHIQNLGKIEVARIGADAAADADAEAHEQAAGA
jgi:hypothetical protein